MTDIVVCASYEEHRALRKSRPEKPLGIGCVNRMPEYPAHLRAYFGGLTSALPVGRKIVVRSLVDTDGVEIWKPSLPKLPYAEGVTEVTAVAVRKIVDNPRERRVLHETTGAYVATMEAGPLARAGVLETAAGVISDNPEYPLRLLAGVLTPEGELDILAFLWAWRLDPFSTAHRIWNIGWHARRALGRMK